tara:strand:- start:353 stop:700 length:348 start_codon:yes stop_codon:yes gene_type:complete
MVIKEFILFLLLIFISQLIIWFQLNGQFFWPSFSRNEILLSLVGVPISWMLIKATKYGYIAFEEILWPQRLIAFATGIILFSICTWIFLGEGITTKTTICLILSITIVLIQVFWK